MNNRHPTFATCQASITGAEHLRTNRCNQDAVAVAATSAGFLLAVADGCSGGRHSEWGARLAVSWLCSNAPHLLEPELGSPPLEEALLSTLETISGSLISTEQAKPSFVHDHLLFTLLVALIGTSHTLILGAGDGCFAVNGELVKLDEDNCPNYLGYGLLEGNPKPRLRILAQTQTSDLQSLLLATDGALALERTQNEPTNKATDQFGLAEFWTAHRYVKNPSLMQKRLNQIAAHTRPFDDTSIVMCRRRPV